MFDQLRQAEPTRAVDGDDFHFILHSVERALQAGINYLDTALSPFE
jgi:predicted aldo/keto reductase-like oxidoreductase